MNTAQQQSRSGISQAATRSNPAATREPGWSKSQRICFFRACAKAGFNDAQRYIAMRHAGCPLKGGKPSVKNGRNTNAMFAQVMALAESSASVRGEVINPPREFTSWRAAAQSGRSLLVNKARCIIAEARDRVPEKFDEGLEYYIVDHTTEDDDAEFVMVKPKNLDEVDGGQAHRIVEALRAFVGRSFHERGMTPRSFSIPPDAKRTTKPRAGASNPPSGQPSKPGAGSSRPPSEQRHPTGAGTFQPPSQKPSA